MEIRLEKQLAAVQRPANLRINDQIRRFREICRRNGCLRPYHHFAFGQSPFPPPPVVVEALRRHAVQVAAVERREGDDVHRPQAGSQRAHLGHGPGLGE